MTPRKQLLKPTSAIESALNRRIFRAVCFVNTNPRDERVQVSNIDQILKKSNIDCYMERPSATFCNGKYSILEDFCFA